MATTRGRSLRRPLCRRTWQTLFFCFSGVCSEKRRRKGRRRRRRRRDSEQRAERRKKKRRPDVCQKRTETKGTTTQWSVVFSSLSAAETEMIRTGRTTNRAASRPGRIEWNLLLFFPPCCLSRSLSRSLSLLALGPTY